MKLTNRTLQFKPIQVVGFASLAAFIAVVVFSFLILSIRSEESTLQKLSQEVKVAQEHVRKLDSLSATAANIEDSRSELDRYFLSEEDIVGFLETIESLGQATNAVVEVTSVDQKVVPLAGSDDGTSSLLLTIETLGSWGNVLHVLGLLESLPVPLVVHRVAYDVDDAEATPPLWKGVFQVSVSQI